MKVLGVGKWRSQHSSLGSLAPDPGLIIICQNSASYREPDRDLTDRITGAIQWSALEDKLVLGKSALLLGSEGNRQRA